MPIALDSELSPLLPGAKESIASVPKFALYCTSGFHLLDDAS